MSSIIICTRYWISAINWFHEIKWLFRLTPLFLRQQFNMVWFLVLIVDFAAFHLWWTLIIEVSASEICMHSLRTTEKSYPHSRRARTDEMPFACRINAILVVFFIWETFFCCKFWKLIWSNDPYKSNFTAMNYSFTFSKQNTKQKAPKQMQLSHF